MITKLLRSLAVSAILALGLSACSSMSDRGPTAFIDSDPQYDDSGEFPTFGVMGDQDVKRPNIRERNEIAKSLVADYKGARYTGEILRGDMDMSALPPTDTVVVATYNPNLAVEEPSDLLNDEGPLRVPEPPSMDDDDVVAMGGPYLTSEPESIDTVLDESDYPTERISVSFTENESGAYAIDVSELRQEVYAQKLAQSSTDIAEGTVSVEFAKSSAPPLPDRVARLLEASPNPEDDEQAFWEPAPGPSMAHLLPVMKPMLMRAALANRPAELTLAVP